MLPAPWSDHATGLHLRAIGLRAIAAVHPAVKAIGAQRPLSPAAAAVFAVEDRSGDCIGSLPIGNTGTAWSTKKPPTFPSGASHGILAVTYSHLAYGQTTIGAERFHFRVRNGIGWFPPAMTARKTVARAADRSRAGLSEMWRNEMMCRIHGAPGSLGVIWSSLTGN